MVTRISHILSLLTYSLYGVIGLHGSDVELRAKNAIPYDDAPSEYDELLSA